MSIMFMTIRAFLVGFIASEEGVQKQAILPVAWVAAVLMAAAAVVSMPDEAHADVCWAQWGCESRPKYWCQSVCFNECRYQLDGWACARYGSAPKWRCKCW